MAIGIYHDDEYLGSKYWTDILQLLFNALFVSVADQQADLRVLSCMEEEPRSGWT